MTTAGIKRMAKAAENDAYQGVCVAAASGMAKTRVKHQQAHVSRNVNTLTKNIKQHRNAGAEKWRLSGVATASGA